MSYIRKGFRQSQRKNVLERNFEPKYKFHKSEFEGMTDVERNMEVHRLNKLTHNRMKGSYLSQGGIQPNTQMRKGKYRNYNHCIDNNGKFIPMEKDDDKMSMELTDLSDSQNTDVFKEYGTPNRYFHLTSPKNWNKIRVYGMVSNLHNRNYTKRENHLYLVQSNNLNILNQVGYGQVTPSMDGLPIVVLEIDKKGIIGELFGEDGGELVTPFHTVLVNQKRILPQYIKYHKTIYSSEKRFYEFRNEMEKGKTEYISKTYDVNENLVGSMRDRDPNDWRMMTGSRESNSRIKLNGKRKDRKLKMVS
jgi:hypothetical protein|tara:strand:- start:285 stop:1199 length:915 start_codon:yes stop_codon:yes gene_type:complete